MKLKYEKAKRQRIKKSRFLGVTNFEHYWLCDVDGKWHHRDEIYNTKHLRESDYGTDYCGRVRSVKAFIRRLKQWKKYLPPGVEFTLISRYVGYCVKGKT